MQRAESYAALAPLLSAQLRRGVVTNCFLSAEDYQRELPRGLYYEEREGCLLLLRQRPGHLILNFYLQPGGTFFPAGRKKAVVTELSCRAKDADAMSAAAEQLRGLGFAECFRRLPARAARGEAAEAEEAADASFDAMRAFLLAQFDPLTGCHPAGRRAAEGCGGRRNALPDRRGWDHGTSALRAGGVRPARSGIWPYGQTAAGRGWRSGCSACCVRAQAGRNARSGRGRAIRPPSAFMKRTISGRTDGPPSCCGWTERMVSP